MDPKTDDFTAGFNDEDNESPSASAVRQEAPQDNALTPPAAAADATTAEPSVSTNDAQDDDPFAALPPKLRELIADIPTLTHRVRSAEGRVAAAQRESAELKRELEALRQQRAAAQAPATPPAPERPRLESVEKLRNELPEVAQALEDVIDRALPKPAPAPEPAPAQAPAPQAQAPAQPQYDPEEALLESPAGFNQPQWREKLGSMEFKLFLAAQDQATQERAQTTTRAKDLAEILHRFDAYQARRARPAPVASTAPAAPVAPPTSDRIAAAAQPAGRARRAPVEPATQDAFLAGFDEE